MRLAIAGDTMLGRGVGEVLRVDPAAPLFSPGLRAVIAEADACVVNLECCISERGERFADPRKPFFFRGPPAAADVLAGLGVTCCTLANNHALDYGPDALLDTLDHLARVGIAVVGAGADRKAARATATIEAAGTRLRVAAATDHPAAYAATRDAPGVAYADLRAGVVPQWLLDAAAPGPGVDATLVAPHWGPNMQPDPVPHVRVAAETLRAAGATLVAGHSAHVFQGVAWPVLFDLGDFIDDYAVDPVLRNDLGLLFIVEVDTEVTSIEAVPLGLGHAHTRLANAAEFELIAELFAQRCTSVGTLVRVDGDRLAVLPA